MLHTSRWNGKLHPDPVVGALEEVHSQRSDRWRSPRLFTSRGWLILHLSQRPEDPGALRVLCFPHTHRTLLNPREGYASGLCNGLHLKQKFPVVFGQVLIDVYRCWGENVRKSKVLILLALAAASHSALFSGKRTALWWFGGISCSSGPAIDVQWMSRGW